MQFRLSTLLLAMVVVGTSVALAGPLGFLLAGYCLLFIWAIRAAVANRPGGNWAVTGLLLFGVVVFCLIPVMPRAGPAARRSQCCNHLLQLNLALHIYRDTHGCFPPPYLADKDGKPMHSWRVLILPYMEQFALWKSYKFDEPWDSPNNRRLAAMRPAAFRCPADGSETPTATSYVMVTGPETASDAIAKGKLDGQVGPNRILLAEVADSGITWTEPRDLTLDEARAGINPTGTRGISSLHGDHGAHVVIGKETRVAGAYVQPVPEAISPEELDALLTGDFGDDAIGSLLADARTRQANQPDPKMRRGLLVFGAWIASLAVLLAHGLIVDARDRKRRANETSILSADATPAPDRADVTPHER
jgi:hypothetical protein